MIRHNYKKQYGQNFLKGSKFVDKLIQPLELEKGDTVIEIGPGTGMVTEKLLRKDIRIIAIEVDYDLIVKLVKKFGNNPNFTLIHQDILEINLEALFRQHAKTNTIKVIGSLPYNISKKIISLFATYNYYNPTSLYKVKKMSFLVQEEVAKAYNSRTPSSTFLSNWLNLFGKVKKFESIPSTQFFPRPKVNGGILVIEPFTNIDDNLDEIIKLIKIGFSSPRKTLRKNLKNSNKWKDEVLMAAIDRLSLKDKARASELKIEQWRELSTFLGKRA